MRGEARLAILFADVAGSTGAYQVLGDTLARDILSRCIASLIDVTRDCGGTLVKTLGDGIMTTFADADAAAAAAVRMQESITGTLVAEGPQLRIRIGFHCGPVLVEESDVYGNTVNIAARIANQAKPGQIITTGATVAMMSDSWRTSSHRLEVQDVRGRGELVDSYEVAWNGNDADAAPRPGTPGLWRLGAARLILTAGGRRLELGEARPLIAVGRSEENDLVVKRSVVSRRHARFEYVDGQFVLVDQSSNGTYVVAASGTSTYLRRKRCVLTGAGMIGLGEAPAVGSPVTIQYERASASLPSLDIPAGTGF